MRHSIGRIIAICALFLAVSFMFLPSAVNAARVTPMVVEIRPSGRDSVARIQLTNDVDRDIAYEVQMMRGDISAEGEMSLTPADEDFVVFPPQALVEGNSQQVFRIQYVGEAAIDVSQIYYLSIRQVPVAFEEEASQVQLVINFNVLVIVEPEGGQSLPSVRSADFLEREILNGDDDLTAAREAARAAGTLDALPPVEVERGVMIDVANDGNRLFRAAHSSITVTGQTLAGEAFRHTFSQDDMTRLLGVGVVAPRRNRRFFLPIEASLDPATVRATIDG